MSDKEHYDVITLIMREGVPEHYKTTLFGNYSPAVVVQIMVDLLSSYHKVFKGETG